MSHCGCVRASDIWFKVLVCSDQIVMTVIMPSGVWRICMNSGPLALMHGYPVCKFEYSICESTRHELKQFVFQLVNLPISKGWSRSSGTASPGTCKASFTMFRISSSRRVNNHESERSGRVFKNIFPSIHITPVCARVPKFPY